MVVRQLTNNSYNSQWYLYDLLLTQCHKFTADCAAFRTYSCT